MLQLATLSARGASEAPDLLITPGCRAAPWPSSTLHRSCFGPAWRSPLQFAISTIGNSAGLIGAGYMIVDELSQPDPCAAGDLRLAETLRTSRTVYGILCERHTAECQVGINSDTPGLDAQHKIISDGQDHRGGSGTRQELIWLFDPQTTAACPGTSPDVHFP